ncbi:MAG TPA: DUF3037 domain-containing protein [Egibacteraceae bacterium]
MHAYEWAALRVVPRVERGEFVNAGVLLYCAALDFLDAGVELDRERVLALDPGLDVVEVERHLRAVQDLCRGAAGAGPAAARGPRERFGWLTAPRSTVVQPSPVHTGLTSDPAAELQRLLAVMVRRPGA